ncbi:restriction endonuclease subunit S [Candidatus Poribacteria bacterium]|nr:restriction endonuclease subunit S [Candidatus Poribacteria bacterium]MYK24671.1 restriction endonuclease subunit S [Candidatus Poribacteria bacterium]
MVTQPKGMPAEKPIKWTSVNVQEIIDSGYRLNASAFGIEARQVRKDLERCRWDIVHLGDKFIEDAFYLGRFKRTYVEEKVGIPFILPSQITEIYPKANKFIAPTTNVDIESTRVENGQVLLTRSGTIGVVSYVSKTLENQSLSDDVIRIKTTEYSGYVYAYLKSKVGNLLISSNNYGAVIQHIEPEHLNHIPIPNPSSVLKQEIHDLIEESFRLRDESNELMDEAQMLLKTALQLPSIEALQEQSEQFDKTAGVLNYSVSSSEVIDRLDGSYYVPIVKVIERHIAKTAREVVKVGDSQICQSVILPGRFKRVYVEEGSGVPFIGGKQIFELDPNNKKYLSLTQHGNRIRDELTLRANMILVTCSGTIGKVAIVPKHWEDWTANQHIIRVVPSNNEIAGYLYAWISSDYAYSFITRYTHGAVIDEINDVQVSEIVVPLLRDENVQTEINDTVLEANRKRTQAYNLEQEALKVLDEKVIYAR